MEQPDVENPSAQAGLNDDLHTFQFEPASTEGPARRIPRWRHAVALLVLMGFISLMAWASFLMGKSTSKSTKPMLSDSPGALLAQTGAELLFFALIWGTAWAFSRASADDLFLRWRGTWQNIALGLAYSIGLRFVLLGVGIVVIVCALVIGITPNEIKTFAKSVGPTPERMVNVKVFMDDPIYRFLLVTWVSFIFAGLREELWRVAVIASCTKVLSPTFSTRNAQIFGVIMSSLFFGIAHSIQGWLAVGMTAVLGLTLGAITLVHRSIWPAVIAHGAFDALSFLLLPLASQMKLPDS